MRKTPDWKMVHLVSLALRRASFITSWWSWCLKNTCLPKVWLVPHHWRMLGFVSLGGPGIVSSRPPSFLQLETLTVEGSWGPDHLGQEFGYFCSRGLVAAALAASLWTWCLTSPTLYLPVILEFSWPGRWLIVKVPVVHCEGLSLDPQNPSM